jgi:lambda repressor-like predicted transcriptional regulator
MFCLHRDIFRIALETLKRMFTVHYPDTERLLAAAL